ncbi:uncharacterized protein IL334_001026 [Kwoniella shivajii]|uniref:Amidase domain-containing protein n=1 Tax=Kwoniella shivajii TaxID=564305 RepID=A0ABZ1CRV5_9TREE|nr:hypothetical protein IL334_001026 [Kwoniella shivajii]
MSPNCTNNSPSPDRLDLLQTSIQQVQALLKNGNITSVQLVNTYLDRIERDNIDGMELRAVIQLAPKESVLKIAKQMDEERSSGNIRGELHGIPILVKDNIAAAHELGVDTTAGSIALSGSIELSSLPRPS